MGRPWGAGCLGLPPPSCRRGCGGWRGLSRPRSPFAAPLRVAVRMICAPVVPLRDVVRVGSTAARVVVARRGRRGRGARPAAGGRGGGAGGGPEGFGRGAADAGA